ncbi:hypothetical protein ABES02_29145 [Neobacillus pocheonensis]|uniref:hypothetical protein n=1 Tax=Neobacillus pocheonensis TaxID=363869 RepID=UPI003D2A8DBE
MYKIVSVLIVIGLMIVLLSRNKKRALFRVMAHYLLMFVLPYVNCSIYFAYFPSPTALTDRMSDQLSDANWTAMSLLPLYWLVAFFLVYRIVYWRTQEVERADKISMRVRSLLMWATVAYVYHFMWMGIVSLDNLP